MKTKRSKKGVVAALQTAVVVVLLCSAGCSSYRVCGYAPGRGGTNEITKQTYRLQRIVVRNVSSMPTIVWTTEFALAKTPTSTYERLVTQKLPNVFSDERTSIPIEVEVSIRSSTGSLGWTILVPYLVTLGIFPAQIQYDDVCGVVVRRLDSSVVSAEQTFNFQHKTMVTAFSPIGLGGFEPDSAATSERSGNGIMAQPEINMDVRNNIAEALAETIAATIATALQQLEAAEQKVPIAPPVPVAQVTPSPYSAPTLAAPSTNEGPTSNTNLVERLRIIKSLRKQGVVTQEEEERLILRAIEQKQQ